MDVINVGTEEDELFPSEPLDIDVVVKLTVEGDKMHYKLVISYLMLGSTTFEDVVIVQWC